MVNSGVVICTRNDAKHRKMIRMTRAPARPSLRPMCCLSSGRRFVVIDMNTRLSTPSTISRKMRLTRLIHASGDAKIDRSTGCKLLLRVPRLFRAGDVHKKRLMARPHESGPRHESRYLRHARPFGHDVDRAACAFETQANYSPTGVWYPTTTQELHNDRNRNSTQRVHIALSQALARGARRAML